MLTKKMDPPAPLHQDIYPDDDDHGYDILDRKLSFDNVRTGDAGDDEIESVVVDVPPSAAAAIPRPDPLDAELTATTYKAASPEMASAVHDGAKPTVDSTSVKSEPSPLSLRPDDLGDSILESIGSMKEGSDKITEPVGAPGQPLGTHSPILDRGATIKVKTVQGGGDEDDDDFTFASQESETPLFQFLNKTAAAAETTAEAGNAGSSDAKLSTDKAGHCDTPNVPPKVAGNPEDAELPNTQTGHGTKSSKEGARSFVVGFVVVLVVLSSLYGGLRFLFPNGESRYGATIATELEETAKITSGDEGTSKELLGAGIDNSTTFVAFEVETTCENETNDGDLKQETNWTDTQFFATEEPFLQDEAHAVVVEPLSIQIAPSSPAEELENESATYSIYLGWGKLKETITDTSIRGRALLSPPEDDSDKSAMTGMTDALQRLQTRWLELKDWLLEEIPAPDQRETQITEDEATSQYLPTLWFDSDSKGMQSEDTGINKNSDNAGVSIYSRLQEVLVWFLVAVMYGFIIKTIKTMLERRRETEESADAQVKSELPPDHCTQDDEPETADNTSPHAALAAEIVRITPMLERSGRPGMKSESASDDFKKYDELTLKDLRLLLKTLFGVVVPVRTCKAELIAQLLHAYRAFLQNLTKAEIRSILESKSICPPSYCTKKQLIAFALHVGF